MPLQGEEGHSSDSPCSTAPSPCKSYLEDTLPVFHRRKTKGASSASIKKKEKKKTTVDTCIRNRTKTSMTENKSRTQKLGIYKVQDAWLHACMKHVSF